MPKTHFKFWKDKFKKNIARDKKKIELLHDQNWKANVIWECQVKADVISCVNRIKKVIN
jgi:DNA mismatch endonuclease (patch repair protein)